MDKEKLGRFPAGRFEAASGPCSGCRGSRQGRWSRAMGSAPVFSFGEFMQRTRPDRAGWKVVPAAARPFPADLREAGSVVDESPVPVPPPVAGMAFGGVAGAARP